MRAALRSAFSLKLADEHPFTRTMDLSSVSMSSDQVAAQYQVSVAKKVQDNVRLEGEQSLKLLQSASPPRSLPAGVGQNLNISG